MVFLHRLNFCFSIKFGGGISVQCSLHQSCHLQIVFVRFNLKVVFPPPFEREVWQMLTLLEKQSMVSNLEKSFQNMKTNDIVHLFNRTIKNILHSLFLMK